MPIARLEVVIDGVTEFPTHIQTRQVNIKKWR